MAPVGRQGADGAPHLSARAYAERRGVDPKAVRKAIKDGRLTEGRSYRRIGSGAFQIFPEAADEEWEETTGIAGGASLEHQLRDAVAPPNGMRSNGKGNALGRDELLAANVDLKKASAEIKMLELAQLRGILVERDTVQRHVERLALAVRQRIGQLPKRVSSQLVGIRSQLQVEDILERAIFEALTELSSGSNLEQRFTHTVKNGSAEAAGGSGMARG